jgi:hypothetical protein
MDEASTDPDEQATRSRATVRVALTEGRQWERGADFFMASPSKSWWLFMSLGGGRFDRLHD